MLQTYSGVFVNVVYVEPKKKALKVFKNNKYMIITMLVLYISFQFIVQFTKQRLISFKSE